MDDRRDRLHALTTEAARVRVVVATLLTSLVATLVVLLATTGDASALHVLVTAGAVGLLAIALTARQARPWGPVPVRGAALGCGGAGAGVDRTGARSRAPAVLGDPGHRAGADPSAARAARGPVPTQSPAASPTPARAEELTVPDVLSTS